MRLTRESLGKARKFGVGPVPLIILTIPCAFLLGSIRAFCTLVIHLYPFYGFFMGHRQDKIDQCCQFKCQDRDLAIPGAILGELHMLCARETRENQCSLSAGQLE